MNKKDRKYRKNTTLMSRYTHEVYNNKISIYAIIDMVQEFTPDPDPYLGVSFEDVFARILQKARAYFGGDSNLESRYHWHTRRSRDFLRRRRLLRKRIKEGGLK